MERRIDISLFINTTGYREWDPENAERYYRTESTPYKGLDTLFSKFQINEGDSLVDFGCGRGRVLFYVYHNFGIDVTGVELNDLSFGELERNRSSYTENMGDPYAPIALEYGYAENYHIKPKDNIFYFFNPFSFDIFEKVVKNIEKSLKEHPRDATIILYYPMETYTKFLDSESIFTLTDTFKLHWKIDKYKKFMIYRYWKKSSDM